REVSLWSAALLGGARRCLVLLLVLLLAAFLPGCARRGLVLLLVLVTAPRRPGPLVAVHRLVLFLVAALPGPPSRGLVLLLVVVAALPPGLLVAVRRFVLLRLTRCHGQGGGDLLFGWWGLSSAGCRGGGRFGPPFRGAGLRGRSPRRCLPGGRGWRV